MPDDPRELYDSLLSQPLTRDRRGQWVVCRHAEVLEVAAAPDLFSSAVSRFLQVPNGLDGSAHAAARALFDPFFSPERMAALEPVVSRIADDLVEGLVPGRPFDAVQELGALFAVRAQSAWLGWPDVLESQLLAWVEDNNAASRSGDLDRTAAVAAQFNAIIHSLIEPRRAAGVEAPDDVTTELVRLRDAGGRPLTDEVLVSVLRNWTGGDLGSIALCVGVVVHWLATHAEHQAHLRYASDARLVAAIDEILRMDDPFVSNRRLATARARVGGQDVAPGERLVLNWTAANRDPEVFGDPDEFDPDGHASANLVYGAGPHVCPGRPLATLELRVLTRSLLRAGTLALDPDGRPEREQPPVGGFHRLPAVLHAAT